MNSFEISTNCITRFLLPTIFPNTTYNELIANNFKKAYIGMLDDDHYDDSLLMLFHKDADENTLAELFDHMDIDIIEDEHNEELQIVVVNNWQDFIGDDDYSNFLSGNFQMFEEQSKQNIVSFWGEDNNSLLYKGLFETDDLYDSLEETPSPLFENSLSVDASNKKVWKKPDIIDDELYFSGDLK